MSESVHAVVAKPSPSSNAQSLHNQQQQSQQQFRHYQTSPSRASRNNHRTEVETTAAAAAPVEQKEEEEVDEDDDIDIIGKFGSDSGSVVNPVPNPLSFMSAASTSLNANNYLLQTSVSAAPNPFSNITFHPNPNYHPHITHPHPQFHPHHPHQQQYVSTHSNLSANTVANQLRPHQDNSSGSANFTSHHQQLTPTNSLANQQLLENSGNSSESFNQEPKNGNKREHEGDHEDISGSHHHQQHRLQSQGSTRTNGNASGSSNTTNEWSTDAHFTPARDRLRRALRYYFMSPIDKWRIKGRFPWKLLFQVVKIILVTTQLILFGNNVTQYRAADSSMLVSLHNLLLLNWDTSRDFKVVPPDSGPYAVYTKEDLYRHIDYAIRNYANISALTVGAFGYQLARDRATANASIKTFTTPKFNLSPLPEKMSTISVCFHRYSNATLNPSLGEYFIDAAVSERCLDLENQPPPGAAAWANFSFFDYLAKFAPELEDFEALLQLQVKLPLRTILLNTIVTFNTPQCFDLDVALNFDNRAHSGEIKVNMVAHNRQIDCRGNLEDHSRETHSHNVHISVNVIVLVLCTLSLVLCTRSLWRGQALRRRTRRFFALAYRRNLESASSLHFIDGWILMILLNDLLLLTGTAINLLRQLYLIGPHSHFSLRPIDFDNICSALLGVGNLLVWCGLLRYLAFFSRYNLLIVTLKHAISRVLRFLLCVLILYGGFCFSGWIILGPYHWKFRTLARTSECLFALMNGDDVFATFAYLQSGSSFFVWWFSRLYLYSFVLLFIYVVLSLFIAILMDSYETIKEFYRNRSKAKQAFGSAKNSLMFSNDQLARFISEYDDGMMMSAAGDDGSAHLGVINEDTDWTTSYRISLLHDEEMEFQSSTLARRRAMEASDQTDGGGGGGGGDNGGCHCCLCHFLQAFVAPLSCFRTAFTSLRSKLSARTGGRAGTAEEDDEEEEEGAAGGDDDNSTNADESATLRIN